MALGGDVKSHIEPLPHPHCGFTLKCTAIRLRRGRRASCTTPRHRGPSAQRPHPACDGPPDLVRRIFLNEMDPRHRLLGPRWPPADEVDQPIIGEERTWLSLQEQL